jgi:hypothetical protein
LEQAWGELVAVVVELLPLAELVLHQMAAALEVVPEPQVLLEQQTQAVVVVVVVHRRVAVIQVEMVGQELLCLGFQILARQHLVLALLKLLVQVVVLRCLLLPQLQRPQKRSHLAEEKHGALCKTG